jgi:hypothetical protein
VCDHYLSRSAKRRRFEATDVPNSLPPSPYPIAHTAARVGDDTLLKNPNHRGAEWASDEEGSEEEDTTTSSAVPTKLDRFGNEVPIGDHEEQEDLNGVEGLVSDFDSSMLLSK